MFGAHPKSQLWVAHVGLLLLLMIVPEWHGYAWWRPKMKWTCCLKNFIKWLKLSTMQRFGFCVVIMVENIKVLIFKSIWKDMASFIRLLVPIHPSKMECWMEKSALVKGCSCFLDSKKNTDILLGRSNHICRILDQSGTFHLNWLPNTSPSSY